MMARPAIHTEDALLDSARAIVADRGVRAATVAAVREASGASIGSIYHRFGSVDEILARAWIRAARRSHDAALAALTDESCECVVAAALAMFDFCVASPDDAVLLSTFRSADFLDAELPARFRLELEHVNDPIAGRIQSLSRAVFGRADRLSIDLLLIAVTDLPSAFAHRHVEAATSRIGPYRRFGSKRGLTGGLRVHQARHRGPENQRLLRQPTLRSPCWRPTLRACAHCSSDCPR